MTQLMNKYLIPNLPVFDQNLVQFTHVMDSSSGSMYCAERKTIHQSLEKHVQTNTIISYLIVQATSV